MKRKLSLLPKVEFNGVMQPGISFTCICGCSMTIPLADIEEIPEIRCVDCDAITFFNDEEIMKMRENLPAK